MERAQALYNLIALVSNPLGYDSYGPSMARRKYVEGGARSTSNLVISAI